MENNANEAPRCALQHNSSMKVHGSMCNELTKILDKVTSILPAIEAARPGCKAGIQELCNLYNTVKKGELIIEHCAECSKLYLAITGEAIVLRCERIRNSLSRSLFSIQNMVPLQLANQITKVLDYLRDVKFVVDSTQEEAGKAILELLGQSDASEDLELETFQLAASQLNITTPKAILIERRSIKKLLDKISCTGSDSKKEGVLMYFLYLFRRYEKHIAPDRGVHENLHKENKCSTPSVRLATKRHEDQNYSSEAAQPPEELCCPISAKLMNDPVTIASGQTYERACIERWFNEGNDTCPRTQTKLDHFLTIPNACMRDLISSWNKEHGFKVPEQSPLPKNGYIYLSEPLHNLSISSLQNVSVPLITGKAGDYALPSDYSNVSIVSSDAGYLSDSSHMRDMEEPKDDSLPFFWNADYKKHQSFSNFDHDMFLRFFYELSELQTEHQRKAEVDLKILLQGDKEVRHAMVSNGFAEAFVNFLKEHDIGCNVEALKAGVQFFLAFLTNSSTEIPSLSNDAFHLIVSYLNSELKIEALMVLHELVHHPNCGTSDIMASVVAPSVFELMETEDIGCLELAMKIICELSSDADVKSHLISCGLISKLAPILSNGTLTECCLKILRSLSEVREATALIAKADGCVASIAEYLDTGSRQEQEHAAAILLAICSRCIDNCSLVMKEGVIPALVDISVNGTDEGKECSIKLLQVLRDLSHSNQFSDSCSLPVPVTEMVEDPPGPSIRKESRSKSSRVFTKKMKFFSKPRSVTLF